VRDDFPERIKEILAQRAGYRCSCPDCDTLTIGPHTEPERVVNTGVAAHITAAAPGGPRHDPTLTPEQRASAENGIWLCGTHARHVDTDVIQFTTDVLQCWKREHEMRVRLDQSGIARPPSMLTEVEIVRQGPLSHVKFSLRKATWIIGNNGAGKTTIAHAIAALVDSHFEEWVRKRCPDVSSQVSISMFTSGTHQYSLSLRDGTFSYQLDGIECPRLPLPVHVLFLQDRFDPWDGLWKRGVDSGNFMSDYARHFGMEANELTCILEHVRLGKRFFIDEIAVRDGFIFVRDHNGVWPYDALSGSRQALVDTEILFRLAAFHARLAPTFVIVEHVPSYLDDTNLKLFASTISGPAVPFQALALMVTRQQLPDFGDALVYELAKQDGRYTLRAGPEPIIGSRRR